MKHIHFLKYSSLAVIFGVFLSACTNDDYFGYSQWNEIREFTVPGQSGTTVISKTADTVTLSVGNGVDVTNLTPNVLEISNFASVFPGKNEARDFSDPVEYVVRAENGIERIWTVTIEEIGANPQLSNSDFNLWYEASAGIGTPIIYDEPGESAENTIWATANYGLTKYKSQPNTTPMDLEGDNFAAKLVTVQAPAVVPLAAATLFTGVFELNELNPPSSAKFGTPFSSRPSGFRLNYVYIPGTEAVIGDVPDECDIYVLLEKRDGDAVARIATGWFRDGASPKADEWNALNVNLKYGPLSTDDPEYDYANIKGDHTWADADDTPTHISVVFSSSARGDIYEGAIDSTLVVDDFELIYE